ncbi:CPBP family intramembrane glutamic endopeptidase [Streptococcus ruminantium]|uniref:CPBP family intramembrane glutamic endopeptidase n=1 Tax=Streptococcus ruminantium TaxID=1917441 RepID=UPI0012DCB6CA|nr:type II CAAX endopeptidase family protein [Streptococcus ruminantium]
MKAEFIHKKNKSYFNLNLIFSPIVGFILLIIGETVGSMVFTPIRRLLPSSAFTGHVLELFSFIFISLAVLLWARAIERSPWLGLGFRKKGASRDFLKGWGIGAAMLITCTFLLMAVGAVTISKVNFTPTLLAQFLIIMIAWSIQGTTEEILVRGWMFPSLSAKHNIPVGIIASSLFFAAIHLGNNAISFISLVDLFLFGVLTCLIMLKTGNIWVISGIHAAWNCFQGNVFAFPVSGSDTGAAFLEVNTKGPEWLSGGQFGVEGSVISLLVQGVMIAWLIYDLYFKNKAK